jgi:hypothetical protein
MCIITSKIASNYNSTNIIEIFLNYEMSNKIIKSNEIR